MITVAQALARIFDLVPTLDTETVPLRQAANRVLAAPATARRDQPPFAASSMDGYGLRESDAIQGARLAVIGEAAAGAGFERAPGPGQAVRIFTGAPVPKGVERVIIQENVTRDGDTITLTEPVGETRHIRPAGGDFKAGERLEPPLRLTPAHLALLAAMNIPQVTVYRRPRVALLATGNELVMPGETPGPDQIIASNSFGLTALAEAAGASARMLPIARDTMQSLETAFSLAGDADLIVTIGGASVGDHDLIGAITEKLGMQRAFYKVAMRPGKPLIAGKLANSALIGLPGNPVSSMICGTIFMQPALRAMQGLPARAAPRKTAELASPLPANGAREHYMRARVENGAITPFERQDSALLQILSRANALLVRPVGDPARRPGETVQYVPL